MIFIVFLVPPSSEAMGIPGEIFSYGLSACYYNPSGIYVMEYPTASIGIENLKIINWFSAGKDLGIFKVGISLARTPKKSITTAIGKDFQKLHYGILLEGFIENGKGISIGTGALYENFGAFLSLKRFLEYKKYDITFKGGYQFVTEEGINLLFGLRYAEDKLILGFSADYEIKNNIDLLFHMGFEKTGGGIVFSLPEDVFSFAFSYYFDQEEWKVFAGYSRIWKPKEVRIVKLVREIPRKEKRAEEIKKPQKPSPEVEEKQKKLLKEGIELYAKEEYEKAIEKWKKVIELCPYNEFAKKAKRNIEDTQRILEKINE